MTGGIWILYVLFDGSLRYIYPCVDSFLISLPLIFLFCRVCLLIGYELLHLDNFVTQTGCFYKFHIFRSLYHLTAQIGDLFFKFGDAHIADNRVGSDSNLTGILFFIRDGVAATFLRFTLVTQFSWFAGLFRNSVGTPWRSRGRSRIIVTVYSDNLITRLNDSLGVIPCSSL